MTGSNASPGSDGMGFDFESWQRRCFEYKLTGKNKPPFPSIEMLWQSFAQSVGELPPPVANLTKNAFFGGCLGFFFVMNKVSEVWNEDDGCQIFERLDAELREFMAAQAAAANLQTPNAPTSSIIQ